jgi:hypothetical protein
MFLRILALSIGLLLLAAPTFAQSQATTPNSPSSAAPAAAQAQKPVATLLVLNATSATLQGNTLSLDGIAPSAITFSDRPVRRAGHISTKDLIELWSTGSFAKDPPNATISAFARDGSKIADAVVVLKHPRLAGKTLSFDTSVLEGELGGADGPASMFIDTIWFGVGDNGIHYLGQSQTTGGISPAFGSKHDTSNPSGWPNPSPDDPANVPIDHRPAASPPNGAPLSAPPTGTR